jgi:hypothetical protein
MSRFGAEEIPLGARAGMAGRAGNRSTVDQSPALGVCGQCAVSMDRAGGFGVAVEAVPSTFVGAGALGVSSRGCRFNY